VGSSWRRGWDLNPRTITGNTLSRRARSARLRDLSEKKLLWFSLHSEAHYTIKVYLALSIRSQAVDSLISLPIFFINIQ
jgi:hypothetical protein